MGKPLRRNRRKHIAELLENRQLLSTYYVDANAPGLTQDGSSWEFAYKDLQAVLTKPTLVSGDTVKVADGTYKPTAGTDRSVSFNLVNGIGVFGGYAGYGAGDPEARDTILNATILSGDIGTVGTKTDNSYHVVTATSVSSSSVIDGVSITLGYADGSSIIRYGGGMLVNSASPTLSNCTFVNNTASIQGGAMNLSSSSAPSLTHCLFKDNQAAYGGGINNESSSPILTHCIFTGNSATTAGGLEGGGTDAGGGMLNLRSSPTLIGCTFIGNTTPYSWGAGLCNIMSTTTLTHCLFAGNKASKLGGGIKNTSSSVWLTNCVFIGNTATLMGGGMYSDSPATLANCTFTGNTASNSGGMYFTSSTPTLTNCILWNNGAIPFFSLNAPKITYSDIEGGYTGTGNLNADPLFVRNPSPGADSKWGTADDDYGDLRLQIASPCIDVGLNSANTTSTDLAGYPRVVNSTIDMGAYETTLPIALAGGSSNDTYVARRSAEGLNLQIWSSADTSGAPTYCYALNSLSAVALDLGDGNDTLLLDLSNGGNLPLSLANVENVQILSSSSTSLALSSTQLTLNSTVIPYTGTLTFLLNSNILNSLSLTGNVSLKLANPNLIVNSGAIPALRSYLANAATGAKPSIVCDSASILALLDNSKLHKTSFAGVSLSAPFSQLLIRSATPGDANLDGVVDQKDLLSIFANLNKTNATWLNGDVDQSGTVDLADLAIVQSKLSAPASMVLKAGQSKAKVKTAVCKVGRKVQLRHKAVRKS